jgi:hypothetical protein
MEIKGNKNGPTENDAFNLKPQLGNLPAHGEPPIGGIAFFPA